MEEIAVQDNPSMLRYELLLDEHVVGEIQYRRLRALSYSFTPKSCRRWRVGGSGRD